MIQHFGSAANLNIYLHCLVLDEMYRCGADGEPVFIEAGAPGDEQVHAVLQKMFNAFLDGSTPAIESAAIAERGVLRERQDRCPAQVRKAMA